MKSTNTPEINIQITINESEIHKKTEETKLKDSSKPILNKINEYSTPQTESASSSSFSRSLSSSSSFLENRTVSKHTLETGKRSTSPMLNKIFDLLDNTQYFPNQMISSQSPNYKYTQKKVAQKENESVNECVSAYEQIVRILDASLNEKIKAHSVLYDYYGDEYEIAEVTQSSYHKINELNNNETEIDYYFKPNVSNYWLDSEPRKVKSIYDEIAHLLDNAHLLKMQKQQAFVNNFF